MALIAAACGGDDEPTETTAAPASTAAPATYRGPYGGGRGPAADTDLIGLLFWRTTARVIRSQVLTTKERTFVKAAIAGGAPPRRVLCAHIAPNVVALALVYGMLLIAEAVMAGASLTRVWRVGGVGGSG